MLEAPNPKPEPMGSRGCFGLMLFIRLPLGLKALGGGGGG